MMMAPGAGKLSSRSCQLPAGATKHEKKVGQLSANFFGAFSAVLDDQAAAASRRLLLSLQSNRETMIQRTISGDATASVGRLRYLLERARGSAGSSGGNRPRSKSRCSTRKQAVAVKEGSKKVCASKSKDNGGCKPGKKVCTQPQEPVCTELLEESADNEDNGDCDRDQQQQQQQRRRQQSSTNAEQQQRNSQSSSSGGLSYSELDRRHYRRSKALTKSYKKCGDYCRETECPPTKPDWRKNCPGGPPDCGRGHKCDE